MQVQEVGHKGRCSKGRMWSPGTCPGCGASVWSQCPTLPAECRARSTVASTGVRSSSEPWFNVRSCLCTRHPFPPRWGCPERMPKLPTRCHDYATDLNVFCPL
jgi:hypothetical protein